LILRYFMWKEWTYTAVCGLFVIFQVYLDLRIPEYMTVITDAIMDGEPSSVIIFYGIEMLICAVASMVVALIANIMSVRAATSLCRLLRSKLFDRVGKFTPEDVHRFSVDSLITRSTNDVSQIQQFITRATPGPAAIMPFGFACQQIYALPRAEGEKDDPHAILGMTDMYARRFVGRDELSFAVPFKLYRRMIEDLDTSFLTEDYYQNNLRRCIGPNME